MSPVPTLSVVVVVHREQGWLDPCVRSILDDAPAELELIAVDDASPDHGPELLDGLADDTTAMRVLHLTERAGTAAARAAGLEQARGEHVWFVRTTDRLAPGGAAAVVEALRTQGPDVLLVHHVREDALGRASAGPHLALLRELAAGGGLDAPLARLAPGAETKIFRRSLLDAAQLGPGGDDAALAWPALAGAQRIGALAEPVYVRRDPPNAVRDAGSPWDALAAHERALAARPDLAPAVLEHELALLRRLPAERRPEYFARMSQILRDRPLAGGPRTRAVQRGNLRAFDMLARAQRLRSAASRRRGALERRYRATAARADRRATARYYRSRQRQPVDGDLAVFAAYWNRGYSCNPRAIYERARDLVPGFRGVWVVEREHAGAFPREVSHVVAGTREYFDVLARARYFVNNVNFPNHLVKRPGTVHVMTHHGTPLKRMGLDLVGAPGSRMDFDALLRRCARWDFAVSSNPLSTVHFERVYPTRYETLEVGYPRNDRLANATEEEVERVRAQLGIEPGQTAVLYTPTHREYRAGYVPTLDLAAVADRLGPEHVLLARLHYFYGGDPTVRRLHEQGRLRDVADHPSIEDLCLAADVLVTDYSSIMFDYAVLDRPIVVHAPDWQVYVAMRGVTFDLPSEPPGVVTRTEAEVVDAIASGAAWDTEASALRAAFRARFCPWDDGRAAERVVRRVWFGEQAAATAPPLAAVR
jgi:CDP-glycerol glycerophosphotransferase